MKDFRQELKLIDGYVEISARNYMKTAISGRRSCALPTATGISGQGSPAF